MSATLTDNFARQFSYLRLSITEVCNFRCNYCLPDGNDCTDRSGELLVDEIARLAKGFAELGTRKIRITGGEPSLRTDLCDIIQTCKNTPGIETVSLTTNGYRLDKDVMRWRDAGLDTLNVSLDSLDPLQFQLITGSKKFDNILRGLALAEKAGFQQLKINSVLMREHNANELHRFTDFVKDRPITLRFIELMQTGKSGEFFARQHVRAQDIKQQLLQQGWLPVIRPEHAGPAQEFMHPQYQGGIGLIMPYSKNFCDDCNRLRVSSQGDLFLCLFAEAHQSLRNALQDDNTEALKHRLTHLIQQKKQTHGLHEYNPGKTRHLAMIGG